MAKGSRRKHSAAFKAKVALAAMAGKKTLTDGAAIRRAPESDHELEKAAQ